MSEKVRDGFESWFLENGYTLRPAETNCGIIIEGDYGHPTVQIAWQAWQASRAALVVELPQKRELRYLRNPYFDGKICGFNNCVDALGKLLDDAGVGYK